ncbi:MAG TPA: hypothetical protein VGR10_01935, partial [Thermoleophilaceae bacterium]|nr:hypothetical protein [Thermoleophilaceae bacterium]
GWSTPGWSQGRTPQGPPNTPAVAAVVLGITGLVIFLGGIVFFPLLISLPCAVAAIVTGRAGMRKVDRGETDRNRALAQAGFITGIAGTILSVLGIVAWILLIALFGEFTTSFETTQGEAEGASAGVVGLRCAFLAVHGLLG